VSKTDRTSGNPWWLAGTALLSFIAGYALDKGAGGPVPAATPPAQSAPAVQPQAWFSSVPAAPTSSAPVASGNPAAPARGDALAALQALPPANDGLERERLVSQLAAALRADDGLRRRTFAAYLKAPQGEAAARLASALGQADAPDLEQAALRASGPESPLPERLASLRLLASGNAPSPSTREALLASLNNGTVTDPALVSATLGALRPGGVVSLAEQARMQTSLQPFLRAPDAVTRQQALDLATAWAPKEAGTVAALKSAVSDPSPDVRATAVAALPRTNASADEVRGVLMARMSDEREVLAVRQAAAFALGDTPMDATTMAAYAAFMEKHKGTGP
jgi:hypothetical protein